MRSFINEQPLSFDEQLSIEIEIYNELLIKKNIEPSFVSVSEIINREFLYFSDKFYNLPQIIFFIRNFKGQTIVGRKIRSILHIENKINAIHCSRISASMLLGFLKNSTKNKIEFSIEYYPFKPEEKLSVFNELKIDRKIDIYYPFKYYDFYTKKEESTPKEGWDLNPAKVIYLGYGEEHLREYTLSYFKNIINKYVIIYDPACSTGQFLYTIKQHFPFCKTIGQDLSEQMVNYAKDFIDEIYCGDSINSPLLKNSVDIMILRFLNSEVVTSKYAHKLFVNLLDKVKVGGLIIVFGHTPLLIKPNYFKKNKLTILQNNGYDTLTDSIFQYYILRK